MSYRVPVYYQGKVVGRVQYNTKLDYWDGQNWTSGATGRHLGFTKLKKAVGGKRCILIYGTDWQGEKDYAELVTDEEAKEAILKAGQDPQDY